MNSKPIHIVAVPGTVRPGNYTSKALNLVIDELNRHHRVRVTLINPQDLQLHPPGIDEAVEVRQELQNRISSATGVVLATPEYHGSFSSVLKLLIENLGFPSVLSGKPVALLGVAAGNIGAIKSLEHLRSVCSHVGAIVLPGPVSIAEVQKTFDPEGNCLNETVEARTRALATQLVDYIEQSICPRIALEAMVRSS